MKTLTEILIGSNPKKLYAAMSKNTYKFTLCNHNIKKFGEFYEFKFLENHKYNYFFRTAPEDARKLTPEQFYTFYLSKYAAKDFTKFSAADFDTLLELSQQKDGLNLILLMNKQIFPKGSIGAEQAKSLRGKLIPKRFVIPERPGSKIYFLSKKAKKGKYFAVLKKKK